jgi:arylsulfatase A-like enzyme
MGLLDNTVVIVASDHGDMLGEHGLLFHEFVLYEPLLRIPFLIMFPDLHREGKRYTGLVQTLDILPTILDYLGIDRSDSIRDIQGKSLLKLVEGSDSRDFTISERSDWQRRGVKARKLDYLKQTYPGFDWAQYEQELVAIRTKEFKYIWSSKTKGELYNLARDPGELTDLIEAEENRGLELKSKLDRWRSSFSPAKQSVVERELDIYVKDKLRKLGYL